MKKIISTILMLAMILSLAAVLTVSTSAAWDGSIASEFTSGTGTEADPYVITTGAQLAYIADQTYAPQNTWEGVYFKLGNNIDLGGHLWNAIGPSSSNDEGSGKCYFGGNFDGCGYTVYNFKVEMHPAGLFGAVNGGSIKNLKVDYADIRNVTKNIAGGIAGRIDNSSLENVEVGANVVVGSGEKSTSPQVGGIVGSSEKDSTMKNIINRATIDIVKYGNNSFIGGIAGVFGNGSSMMNAINYGNIVFGEEYLDVDTFVGGICGALGSKNTLGTLVNVINYGNVNTCETSGGIIGRINSKDNASVVTNAYVCSSSITAGAKNSIGTVVGYALYSATATNVVSVKVGDLEGVGKFKKGQTFGDIAFKDTVAEVEAEEGFKAIIEAVNTAMPKWTEVETPVAHPAETEIINTVAPGCTTEGYTGDIACADCGLIIEKGEAVPATGHVYGNYVLADGSNLNEDGTYTKACHCGELGEGTFTVEVDIPVLKDAEGNALNVLVGSVDKNAEEYKVATSGYTDDKILAALNTANLVNATSITFKAEGIEDGILVYLVTYDANGIVAKATATVENGTVTFDAVPSGNCVVLNTGISPETGDNTLAYVIALVAVIALAGATVVVAKKRAIAE